MDGDQFLLQGAVSPGFLRFTLERDWTIFPIKLLNQVTLVMENPNMLQISIHYRKVS
jgi:hypothetical protein